MSKNTDTLEILKHTSIGLKSKSKGVFYMEVKILSSTGEAKKFLSQSGVKQTHTLKPEQIKALENGKWLAWEHNGAAHLIGAEGKVDEEGINN